MNWNLMSLFESSTKATNARLESILANISEGIISTNQHGKIVDLNPVAATMFGFEREELMGRYIWTLIPEAQKNANQEDINTYMIPGKKEVIGLKKNGERFSVELSVTEMKFEDSIMFVGIMRDISERKMAEAAVKESETKFRLAFDFSPTGIAIVSLEGRWLQVNQALCKMLGYTPEELLKLDFQTITHPEDLSEDLQYVKLLRDGDIPFYQLEKRYIRKDKKIVWILLTGSVIRNEQGEPIYYIAQIQDINDKKQVDTELSYQAYYDALTGLVNRVQLVNSVEVAISTAERYHQRFAILFLDIDHFKRINDTLGHDAGDQLLKVVADRLKANIRKSDVAARLGGDEFVILLQAAQTPEIAAVFAEKIISTISQPIKIKDNELTITTSVGISFYEQDGLYYDSLIKSADLALYAAKEKGRNNYQFCTQEMNNQIKEKSNFKAALRLALEKQEFHLVFQPKINIKHQRIIGFEALLRWESEVYGQVSPEKIINTAEEMGLIVDLGNWIVKNACEQTMRWNRHASRPVKITINISAKHYAHVSFVENIITILQNTGLSGKFFDLEISEDIIMHDPDYSLKVIRELKQHGIEVTIDNFGTGYSSLNYLHQFSVNRIKTDRKFTQFLATDVEQTILLKAMIGLANNLHIRIQAEGVETKEQYDLLAKMGCDEIQGYYISYPILSEKVPQFLQAAEARMQDAEL
jgi:diguanylate cyclase (GGDEF)-like protein/PAS domain S-box-containing protein